MSPEPILHWSSWPFKERTCASIALCSFILLVSVLLWKITVIEWETPWFFFVGFILFVTSLLPYFIKTEYELYEDRIHIKYLFINVNRKYQDFSCFYKDKHGIMLSTFVRPRRLDAFRGQSLRFSATGKEMQDLIRILGDKIGKQY